jgi:hypothetical protein
VAGPKPTASSSVGDGDLKDAPAAVTTPTPQPGQPPAVETPKAPAAAALAAVAEQSAEP